MQYKIGIFGSNADKDEKKDELPKNLAEEFGEELSKFKATVITGACSGIPYAIAYEADKRGCNVVGFSPELDIKGQKLFTPTDDLSIYTKIVFVPRDFEFTFNKQVCKKYRNVISTANCDGGIIIAGRWGTLNEFTNLYDMGKVIGVLTGIGGIADELSLLSKKITKKSKAKVFFSNSPSKLIQVMHMELKKRHLI